MNKITLLGMIFSAISCFGQKENIRLSLADGIRQKFSYDSLGFLSCVNTPAGIYVIKFKADKKKRLYDFIALNDSFRRLNQFFVDAIKKSAYSTEAKTMHKGDYLQIIYFNNIIACNDSRNKNDSLITPPPDTSITFSNNYDKEVIKTLSSQLLSIESSLTALQKSALNNKQFIILPPAIINNENPNDQKGGPGFKNDTPPNSRSKEQIKQIERIVNDRKKKVKQ